MPSLILAWRRGFKLNYFLLLRQDIIYPGDQVALQHTSLIESMVIEVRHGFLQDILKISPLFIG